MDEKWLAMLNDVFTRAWMWHIVSGACPTTQTVQTLMLRNIVCCLQGQRVLPAGVLLWSVMTCAVPLLASTVPGV